MLGIVHGIHNELCVAITCNNSTVMLHYVCSNVMSLLSHDKCIQQNVRSYASLSIVVTNSSIPSLLCVTADKDRYDRKDLEE